MIVTEKLAFEGDCHASEQPLDIPTVTKSDTLLIYDSVHCQIVSAFFKGFRSVGQKKCHPSGGDFLPNILRKLMFS